MRVQICCPSLIHASACTDLIVVLASIASVAASGGLCFSCLQPLHCSDTLLRECLCVCSRIKYDKAPSGLDLSRLPSGDEWLHAGSWAGTNVKSIRMVRVLRALRVISSFKSLRKIILALTQAIFPVMSAMFVALLVITVQTLLQHSCAPLTISLQPSRAPSSCLIAPAISSLVCAFQVYGILGVGFFGESSPPVRNRTKARQCVRLCPACLQAPQNACIIRSHLQHSEGASTKDRNMVQANGRQNILATWGVQCGHWLPPQQWRTGSHMPWT